MMLGALANLGLSAPVAVVVVVAGLPFAFFAFAEAFGEALGEAFGEAATTLAALPLRFSSM